jgi:hypothetical protein
VGEASSLDDRGKMPLPQKKRTATLCDFLESGLLKSIETVMPDLISLPRTTIRGHPELIAFNGFRLPPE